MNLKLKAKLKTVPQKPGVYFWRAKTDQVLYVGRATNLKNRLSQYFQSQVSERIAEMVSVATSFDYQVTDTVLEAIVLEAKQIKKFWPKYNIVDRDDRSFLYVVIPKKVFAKPLIVRARELDKFPSGKAKVFGPYQSFRLLQNALRLLRPIFPYGNCQPKSGRACFDYQIGLCPGSCIGAISLKDYQRNLDNLSLLLAGEKKRLLNRLVKENPDKARALRHLQEVSLLVREDDLSEEKVNRLEGYDISHHSGKESYGAMVVFENGKPAKKEYRLFKIKTAPAGDDERALEEVLQRRFKHDTWPRPDIIMIDGGRPQINWLYRSLKKQGLNIPLVGISKLAGDELIFTPKTKKEFKDLTTNIKPTLLKLREEAHRFANFGRQRQFRRRTLDKKL